MTDQARHVVSLQTATPRTIAAVRARVPIGSVPTVFRQYLDQVYAVARTGAAQLDGQNVFLYGWTTERPDQIDVAFGVGVTQPFAAAGAVEPVSLPTGEVATTTHWGNYAGLRDAHAAVQQWCDANSRRTTGQSWEVYGHWNDDESKRRTDIYYLLERR